jgi:hypothetical protein
MNNEVNNREVPVEVKAEPAARPGAVKTVLVVARAIITDVEDIEIDEGCLRLAAEYLVRAAMALRSIPRDAIETTSAAELAEITSDILYGAEHNT